MFELSPDLADRFPEPEAFDKVMALDGKIYREKEGRRTLSFEWEGKGYFAKLHGGVGWREIFKAWSRGNKPDVDASPEWCAIARCEEIGVDTMVIAGRGMQGTNPAKRKSFLITEALEERLQLDHFGEGGYGGLSQKKKLRIKRHLCRRLGGIAKKLHENGVNHRDFYLCHFQVKENLVESWDGSSELPIKLLDLHRAQIRSGGVPERWLVKDLGALLFSAIDCEITDRDLVAFLEVYLGASWKKELRNNQKFWLKVKARAIKFYRRHRGKDPVIPAVFANF